MVFVNTTIFKQYEVKKSIFISYVTPINKFKTLLKNLKNEHPKASHIIYAYRTLNEYDQIVENSSDDGEPKGCAGAPTLAVIRGIELIESAIITVRYFGGTKLGTGGMVRAYSGAAKEVIKSSKLETYEKKFSITFHIPYTLNNRYEHYFKSANICYSNRKFEATYISQALYLTEAEIGQLKEFQQTII